MDGCGAGIENRQTVALTMGLSYSVAHELHHTCVSAASYDDVCATWSQSGCMSIGWHTQG
jgi:hypothetical protein